MSHHVVAAAGVREDGRVVDPERGLFLLSTGRGASGGMGSSQITWAFEEAAGSLRGRVDAYERAPSAETRKAVLESMEKVLDGIGPATLSSGTPEGRPATSFVGAFVGPGFAFVAHRGESRLDVIRDGEVHRATPFDGNAKLSHLDLLPGDRLVLSSRGFPKGALAKPPTSIAGSAEDAAKGLLALAEPSTVAVVDPPASREAEALVARARALGKLFLFDGLPFESRLRVNAICHRKTFLPDQAVVREGDAGDSMYVVTRGHLKVTLHGKELTRLGPGDHFGELALAEDMARSATVTAVDDGELVELSRRDLTEFSRANPDEGMQLAWRLVQHLGRRVRDLSAKVAG